MGTETRFIIDIDEFVVCIVVKLNNPLMGTETS